MLYFSCSKFTFSIFDRHNFSLHFLSLSSSFQTQLQPLPPHPACFKKKKITLSYELINFRFTATQIVPYTPRARRPPPPPRYQLISFSQKLLQTSTHISYFSFLLTKHKIRPFSFVITGQILAPTKLLETSAINKITRFYISRKITFATPVYALENISMFLVKILTNYVHRNLCPG